MRLQQAASQLVIWAALSWQHTSGVRLLALDHPGPHQDLRALRPEEKHDSIPLPVSPLALSNLHSQQQASGSFHGNTSTHEGSAYVPDLRLLACTLLKNEVPYLVEWIEFHRLVGFSHLVIYDDGSEDHADLIERFYKQQGRRYVSYETISEWDDNPRNRRTNAGGECLKKYKHLADWIIHLDIDEFILVS